LKRPAQLWVKRAIDVAVSLVGLALLSVPMAVVAAVIRLESPGPALLKQERAGQGGRPFVLYKFRSMREAEPGREAHEQRVTPFGALIRRWRVDELPQLLNVLKGDMSLVGPRPTLPYQVERYNEFQRRRLEVKPGITGWAQIHGDKAPTWPERIELDVWYVDNWSLALDIRILLMTPLALLRIRKVNVETGPPEDEISKEVRG